jgi:hypothetical protein
MKTHRNIFYFLIILMILSLGIRRSLYSQVTGEKSTPQYLFADFSMSKVKMKSTVVNTSLMNFNTVTGKMVFLEDDEYYVLLNPLMVDTINLNNHLFIPVGETWYEVLLSGPVSLYVQHTGKLLHRGKAAGYGGTSEVSATETLSSMNLREKKYNLPLLPDYIVENSSVYWIRKESNWFSFASAKQFLKIFPEKSSQLKSFIKEYHLKTDNPEHLKKIMVWLNGPGVK